jgi:hypothetical protein
MILVIGVLSFLDDNLKPTSDLVFHHLDFPQQLLSKVAPNDRPLLRRALCELCGVFGDNVCGLLYLVFDAN